MDEEKTPLEQFWERIESHDVIWVAIPFSRTEMRRLARHRGILTEQGVMWQEIRESLGLVHKPRGWRGSHYAFHQGSRMWMSRRHEGAVAEVMVGGEATDADRDDARGSTGQGTGD